MADKRWKAHEREAARLLGTTRNASNGQRNNDIDAGRYAIEHKSTKDGLNGLLRGALHQAREGAAKRGRDQLPIVVISYAPGRGHKVERFVLMDFAVFQRMKEGANDAEG